MLLAASSTAPPPAPTPAQIGRAITVASRSTSLWATVNRCGPTVGIRGQMPALSFPSHLLMAVQVQEYSAAERRFVDVGRPYRLGGQIAGAGEVVQQGIALTFASAVSVRASVEFEWFRDGRRLGSSTRLTSARHDRDHASPSGYSAASCLTA